MYINYILYILTIIVKCTNIVKQCVIFDSVFKSILIKFILIKYFMWIIYQITILNSSMKYNVTLYYFYYC